MRTIRLDIEYPARVLRTEPGGEPAMPQDISLNVILRAVNTVYNERNGMNTQKMRMWSRIEPKLSGEDGKAVAGPIELSPEQFDFLNETVTKADFPPIYATPVTALLEDWDRIKSEKKE